MKRMLTAVLTALLLCLSASALADVTFMDVTVPEDAEYVDFGDAAVTDLDALADFLAQLPAVKRVDMFANQMVKADCDRLAERFPQIRWGWTLLIKGKDHKHLIRTDRETFSTLHNNKSTVHTGEDFAILKYCWDLKALDIGHNNVTDLSFLYDLPDLRILILAANQVTDITPLASLKKLEYLEMFKNRVEDLSPLKELTHLMDLNLCNNRVKNLEVLGEMPWLKRLWIYQATGKEVKKADARALQALLPNTQVDYLHSGTNGTWRNLTQKKQHPHYQVIVLNFGANHLKPGDGSYYPFEDSWPEE